MVVYPRLRVAALKGRSSGRGAAHRWTGRPRLAGRAGRNEPPRPATLGPGRGSPGSRRPRSPRPVGLITSRVGVQALPRCRARKAFRGDWTPPFRRGTGHLSLGWLRSRLPFDGLIRWAMEPHRARRVAVATRSRHW